VRLGHYDLGSPIELSEDRASVLIVENPRLMSRLIADLIVQRDGSEGGFALWDGGESVPLDKAMEVVFDPFSADVNKREILAKLYGRMKGDALGEDLYMHTNGLLSEIEAGLRRIIDDNGSNLESDSPDIVGLFKLANVRFAVSESLLERLCDYMDACHGYLGARIFVFVNLKSFLSEQEMLKMYEHSRYHKHVLLLIENRQSWSSGEETTRIIDSDLCEIGFSEDDYL
jgi:CRISPR-associated protein Csn2